MLPARHWTWRMRTAALGLVERVVDEDPDLLFVSDFLNLAELRALLPPGRRDLPAVLYLHENQLTYPLRAGQRRDVHHGLTNLHAALAAERVLFNSAYHRDGFLAAAADLLGRAPDLDLTWAPGAVAARSDVLPLGCDLGPGAPRALGADEPPVLAWTHRWEYDKAPERLLALTRELVARGVDHRLLLLGERFRDVPAALVALEDEGADRIVHSGFAPSRAAYLELLDGAHLAVSTARHEFFGLATLEALRRGLLPVLPDDLAYPELLPEAHREAPWLYPREAEGEPASLTAPGGANAPPTRRRPGGGTVAGESGSSSDPGGVLAAADAVEAATARLRAGTAPDLVSPTLALAWDRLAPRYDAVLEAAAGA